MAAFNQTVQHPRYRLRLPRKLPALVRPLGWAHVGLAIPSKRNRCAVVTQAHLDDVGKMRGLWREGEPPPSPMPSGSPSRSSAVDGVITPCPGRLRGTRRGDRQLTIVLTPAQGGG